VRAVSLSTWGRRSPFDLRRSSVHGREQRPDGARWWQRERAQRVKEVPLIRRPGSAHGMRQHDVRMTAQRSGVTGSQIEQIKRAERLCAHRSCRQRENRVGGGDDLMAGAFEEVGEGAALRPTGLGDEYACHGGHLPPVSRTCGASPIGLTRIMPWCDEHKHTARASQEAERSGARCHR
jgi:hypothetical protein